MGFFAHGELQRLDLGGGAPRPLAAAPYGQGGAWNADGVIVFAPSLVAPLSRIPASAGAAVAATKLTAKQGKHADPVFLPDGRHFLFTAAGASAEARGIYLAALGTTAVQRLTFAQSNSAYLPPGWLLWVQTGGNLVAQRLNLKRQRLTGDPVTIADAVAADAFSVSATGLVAYRAGGGSVHRQLTWFDHAGKPLGMLGDPGETLLFPSVSPDGRFVAYESNESGRFEIYIRPFSPPGAAANPAGGQWQSSTDGGIQPRWSPDGRQLYYLDPQGRMMAVSITVTGTSLAPGAPVLLFATKIYGDGVQNRHNFQYAVARDGRFLINTVLEENRSTAPITLILNWRPPGQCVPPRDPSIPTTARVRRLRRRMPGIWTAVAIGPGRDIRA